MIDVKEAVTKAVSFVREAFENEKISNLGLEQIELTDDERFWLVTLGFSRPWDYPKPDRPHPVRAALVDILPKPDPRPEREYKVLKVDAETGKVKAMKMLDE